MRIVITAPPDAPRDELQRCFQAALFAKDHESLGPRPGDVMLVSWGGIHPQETRAVVRRKTGVTVYARGYWDRED